MTLESFSFVPEGPAEEDVDAPEAPLASEDEPEADEDWKDWSKFKFSFSVQNVRPNTNTSSSNLF